MDWEQVLAAFAAWMLAGGASSGTIKLRVGHVRRLAQVVPDPAAAQAVHLVRFLAVPGWAAETRKSVRSSLRVFFGWAVDHGLLQVDPAGRLPRVRVPAGVPRPCPDDVVMTALSSADPDGRLMLLLGWLAGLRRSEIARVHSRDLVLEDLLVTGKGGRQRRVPVHPLLAAELDGRTGWVLPGQIEGHLSAGHVGVRLAELLGGGWTGHSLRHAAACRWYAVERDLRAVQQLLGHSKPETTARYTAVPDGAHRRAVLGGLGQAAGVAPVGLAPAPGADVVHQPACRGGLGSFGGAA